MSVLVNADLGVVLGEAHWATEDACGRMMRRSRIPPTTPRSSGDASIEHYEVARSSSSFRCGPEPR